MKIRLFIFSLLAVLCSFAPATAQVLHTFSPDWSNLTTGATATTGNTGLAAVGTGVIRLFRDIPTISHVGGSAVNADQLDTPGWIEATAGTWRLGTARFAGQSSIAVEQMDVMFEQADLSAVATADQTALLYFDCNVNATGNGFRVYFRAILNGSSTNGYGDDNRNLTGVCPTFYSFGGGTPVRLTGLGGGSHSDYPTMKYNKRYTITVVIYRHSSAGWGRCYLDGNLIGEVRGVDSDTLMGSNDEQWNWMVGGGSTLTNCKVRLYPKWDVWSGSGWYARMPQPAAPANLTLPKTWPSAFLPALTNANREQEGLPLQVTRVVGTSSMAVTQFASGGVNPYAGRIVWTMTAADKVRVFTGKTGVAEDVGDLPRNPAGFSTICWPTEYLNHGASAVYRIKNAGQSETGIDALAISVDGSRYFWRQDVTVATGQWTQSTQTLTKTGAFSSYIWADNDYIYISGGTGWTVGWYRVASKTSNDAIVLSVTSPPANTADMAANAFGVPGGQVTEGTVPGQGNVLFAWQQNRRYAVQFAWNKDTTDAYATIYDLTTDFNTVQTIFSKKLTQKWPSKALPGPAVSEITAGRDGTSESGRIHAGSSIMLTFGDSYVAADVNSLVPRMACVNNNIGFALLSKEAMSIPTGFRHTAANDTTIPDMLFTVNCGRSGRNVEDFVARNKEAFPMLRAVQVFCPAFEVNSFSGISATNQATYLESICSNMAAWMLPLARNGNDVFWVSAPINRRYSSFQTAGVDWLMPQTYNNVLQRFVDEPRSVRERIWMFDGFANSEWIFWMSADYLHPARTGADMLMETLFPSYMQPATRPSGWTHPYKVGNYATGLYHKEFLTK